MTHFPPPALHEKRRKILLYIGIALSAGMVLTVLTVLALIMRTERAHDEASCPFVPIGEQQFADGKLLEEQRSCIDTVTERRYRVARNGQPIYELARKRMGTDRFTPLHYRWTIKPDGRGRLILTIFVDGKISSEFREEDASRP